jgi:glycosyl hydrolase family 35
VPVPRVATTIELSGAGLRVDGERQPMVAGQFEYWRNHSVYWDRILGAVRDLGVTAISTFVCWDFHELEPGRFDFHGETYPTRDLAGFVDACARHELAIYLRIGPIIDAEWPTRGPAPDVATLERLHPRFWRRTREYLAALAPVVVPRQATRGGPIVLVGLDNEICFPYSTAGEDAAVHADHEVPYDEELVLDRYVAWALEHGPSTHAPRHAPNFRRDSLAATLEAFDFISDQVGDYLQLLVDACREEGIDVPLYTNMKQFTCFIDWGALERRLDVTAGANLHISNGWPGPQKLVVSWYWRVLRATLRLPWAPELQGGPSIKSPELERHFGIMDVDQPRRNTLLSAALGMRGLSYYMLVERDDTHYAPINPLGVVRPQARRLRDAVEAVAQLGPDRHLADVALIWSLDHHRCQVATTFDGWDRLFHVGRQTDAPKELAPWWFTFDQLHQADADFALATADNWDAYDVLIYAGPDFLAEEQLLRLAEWVERGGRLVVATALPDRGRDGECSGAMLAARRALLNSPRVLLRPWGHVEDGLRWAGAEPYVRAAAADVWTFAYEDADGWTLFAVNVGEAPATAAMTLRADLAERLAMLPARDLLHDGTWPVDGRDVWDGNPPQLAPNEAAALRVEGARRGSNPQPAA